MGLSRTPKRQIGVPATSKSSRGHQISHLVSQQGKNNHQDTKTAFRCPYKRKMIMTYEKNDFWDRERECERFFIERGPFYYITTENLNWLLYQNREEFIMGTNILAISAARSGFTIVDDVQMNNHHHVMGAGTAEQAKTFADLLHGAERKYQTSLGRPHLKVWDIKIDRVPDLKQFRNQVAYTDRNAYVARIDSMPMGYAWGSANLFFNGNLWLMNEGVPFAEVGGREKRTICRSHEVELPANYRAYGGMILRRSFVEYHTTERLFNSANQYFTMLTKRGEADIEMAQLLGERIQLPHEEVLQIVGKWFSGKRISDLKYEEKLQTAQKMKQRLASSNRQIIQITGLSPEDVDRLFPKPS